MPSLKPPIELQVIIRAKKLVDRKTHPQITFPVWNVEPHELERLIKRVLEEGSDGTV